MVSASACDLVSLERSLCKAATSSFNFADCDVFWSMVVVYFLTCARRSSLLAVESPSSLSQYALCVASSAASSSSFLIMSVIKPFTLANGSEPVRRLERMAEAMRVASCARACDCCLRAKSLTNRTASKFARSTPLLRRDSWMNDAAPPVASMMIFFGCCDRLELLTSALGLGLEVLRLGHAILVERGKGTLVSFQVLLGDLQVALCGRLGLLAVGGLLLGIRHVLVAVFDLILEGQFQRLVVVESLVLLFAGVLELVHCLVKEALQELGNAASVVLNRLGLG